MTIFGLYITTSRARKAEKSAELGAHVDECNAHLQAYRALQRHIDELEMQKNWWRLQYETQLAVPRTIRITRTGDLLRLGDGIKIEVDPRP